MKNDSLFPAFLLAVAVAVISSFLGIINADSQSPYSAEIEQTQE